ncbi:unnamed protein product [Cyclocybe aegerita]|uniref:Uncharacterized protein n=1 Tax=Cyclocybe aegerita TaxID=1973307 RepID=A0A8S0VUL8_CYCAE|nr:unnamed protein product [Cyclocybe aegerita]
MPEYVAVEDTPLAVPLVLRPSTETTPEYPNGEDTSSPAPIWVERMPIPEVLPAPMSFAPDDTSVESKWLDYTLPPVVESLKAGWLFKIQAWGLVSAVRFDCPTPERIFWPRRNWGRDGTSVSEIELLFETRTWRWKTLVYAWEISTYVGVFNLVVMVTLEVTIEDGPISRAFLEGSNYFVLVVTLVYILWYHGLEWKLRIRRLRRVVNRAKRRL